MAKDSTTLEYTHKTGMFNLYGKAMLATSTHVLSNEGKVLQHLTNELFEAAQADLLLDKEAGITRENPERKERNTKNYDIFINRLADKIQKTPEEVKILLENETYKSGKSIFKTNYEDLKIELDKTRVFGVGKSLSEKAVTIATNTARVAVKAVGAAAAVFLSGVIIAVAAAGTDSIEVGTDTSNSINPAIIASTAGYLRGQLKDGLEGTLTKQKMNVPKKGILEFMKKAWKGNEYKPTTTNKPVLSQKLWKAKQAKKDEKML